MMTTLRRIPASLIFLAVLWAGQLLDPHSLAVHAPWRLTDWHVLTSGLTAASVSGVLVASLALVVFVIPAEVVLGTRYFALVVFAIQVVATPVGLLAGLGVEQAGLNRWGADLSSGELLSPLPWILGVATVAASKMPAPWGRRVTAATLALSCTMTLYAGTLADVVSLTAVALALMVRRPGWRGLSRISAHETRIVVATVVACVAFGPLVTQLDPHAGGPLAESGFFAWTEITGNVGWLLVNLVLTAGLMRGRRLAWWLALATNLVAAVVIVTRVTVVAEDATFGDILFGFPQDVEPGVIITSPELSLQVVVNLVLIAAPWLAAAALLVATRKAFVARVNRAKLVRFGLAVSVAVILAAVVGHPTVLIACLAIMAYAVLMSVPEISRSRDREQARALLQRGTGDHLQQMTLWDGHRYWFDPEGAGYVAYRVSHGVAVTIGEPVRVAFPPSAADAGAGVLIADDSVADAVTCDRLASGFAEFVRREGWALAWYSVAEGFAARQADNGYRRLHVADESLLSSADVAFRGKRFQNIRTARNHARKTGVTARWLTWDGATVAERKKITELSEQWAETKALPEMGFTLGGLGELSDPDTRILIAVDQDERLQAVTSWLPVRENGRIVGLTLDMMRRDAQGFRPAIEFLLSEALIAAEAEGLAWISLSGAPLATHTAATGLLDRALQLAGGVIEPLYGFRSLAASKHKFHPTISSWYLLYDDEAQLPAIGLAVCSCYLPGLKLRDAATAMRALARPRETSAVAAP